MAAAIATPLTGWLCDRFSQKSVFLVSVAGFTLASILCGISSSLTEIVTARLLQGLFGAALVPLSQAVLLDINPPKQHGSAMVGALAFYGIWRYIRHEPAARKMEFDLFGFAMLSLAIAALQMLLDRGEQNDWYTATEKWICACC